MEKLKIHIVLMDKFKKKKQKNDIFLSFVNFGSNSK